MSKQTYADTVKELQRSYDFFVDYFKLNPTQYSNVVLTLMTSGRKQANGWVGDNFWTTHEGKMRELNISAEYLNQPITDILGVLLHQMAHLKNNIEFNIDPNQKYHTKVFKEAAEFFGLTANKQTYRGYSDTNVDQKALNAIKALNPRNEVYKFSRVTSVSTTPIPNKKYVGIFIDSEFKDNLERACQTLKLKKKEVVEKYLANF